MLKDHGQPLHDEQRTWTVQKEFSAEAVRRTTAEIVTASTVSASLRLGAFNKWDPNNDHEEREILSLAHPDFRELWNVGKRSMASLPASSTSYEDRKRLVDE